MCRPRTLVLLVSLLIVSAACGGGDDGSNATPTTSTSGMSTTAAPDYPADVEPVPSPGCDAGVPPRAVPLERERRTLTIGGEERWYLLSVPRSHDGVTPQPLVVELHGLAEGAAIAAEMSQIDALGATEGFVSVFPNGSGTPVRWNQHLDSEPNRDFELIAAMLDTLGDALCIDEARTYATGLSYGAIMSSALACTMADRFAAIAPVAGIERPVGCKPTRPVPVLAFHGTADPILFFNGGVGDLSAALGGGTLAAPDGEVDLDGPGYPAAVAAWAAGNGCDDAPSDVDVTEQIIERSYECAADAEVRFFIIEGGGHSWPSSAFSEAIAGVVGPTTRELDATKEIWTFFERHARPS